MSLILRFILLCLALLFAADYFSAGFNASFLGFWAVSMACTYLLAKQTRHHTILWTIAAILLPFIAPVFLVFSKPKPYGALTLVDNSWFNMERPTNLMMVTGVLFFEEHLSLPDVKHTVSERLLCLPRFRQKVKHLGRHACWLDDDQFNLDDHISEYQLPAPGDELAFQNHVNELSSKPLNFNMPLWHIEIVQSASGKSAAIFRIHHCIGDGTALIRVLLSLTDSSPTEPQNRKAQAVNNNGYNRARSKPMKSNLPTNASHLHNFWHQVVGFAAAVKKGVMLPDANTSLKNPLTGRRVTAWSEPVSVERVRTLAHMYEAKINDIVLATTAGAIRHYLSSQGESVDGIVLRVLVPINLRPLEGPLELGNKVGFVYLPLPVDIEDPIARLKAVKQTMDEIKGGQEAVLSYLFLTLIGTLPTNLQHFVIDTFNKNASSTMTNVPGPKETLYLAHHKISNMMFFGPQSGTMGVGISVLSYDGKITLGINADANLVKSPEKFSSFFKHELENWPTAQKN